MTGNGNTNLKPGSFLNLIRNLVRDGGPFLLFSFFLVVLLGQGCVLLGDGTFCDSDDGKALSGLGTIIDGFNDLVDIIRDLRQQDNIRAAGNTGIERKPANLMSHNFNDKNTVMRSGGGMNAVDGICCNINCTVEAKGHVGSPDIIVDCLGKMNDIQTLLAKKICGLLSTVSAENDQAVQTKLIIILFHGFDLIQTVFIRCPHQLEGLAGAADDGAALCQDSGKITRTHETVIAVDQTLVAVNKAIDLKLIEIVSQTLDNTSHGGI